MRSSVSLGDIVDFCQMCTQISSFVCAEKSQPNEPMTAFHIAKKEFLCTRCGTKHMPKSCPAYKKNCNKCGKPGHYFAKVCRNKRFRDKPKHVGFEKHSHSIDIFSVDTFEKAGITKEVKVCGKIMKFQLDQTQVLLFR